jgi:hypothetical protein
MATRRKRLLAYATVDASCDGPDQSGTEPLHVARFQADRQQDQAALTDANVNLYCGLVMLAFGLFLT